MDKSLSRILFLSALGLTILSLTFLILWGFTDQWPPRIIGITCGLLGTIFAIVAWIGALVKMVQLKRWGWFVFLLFFNYLGTLIYIFAGPTTVNDPPSSHHSYNSHEGYHWEPVYTPYGDQGRWVQDK